MAAPHPLDHNPLDSSDAVRRAGVFLLLVTTLWLILPGSFLISDVVLRSVAATLGAGLIANLISARLFETGRFSDFGLGWRRGSGKQLIAGFALGVGAVSLLALGALVSGVAKIERVPIDSAWPLPVLAILLFLAALGEETMFRGYGFQVLARGWNAGATIVGVGVVFGMAHFLTNPGISLIGTLNTALWGSLLGYAWWRTRTLWMPAGLHFGWNLGLVLIGVPLSGLTIKATGFALRWTGGELFSGGDYGPENGWLTTVCGGVVFLFLRRGGLRAGGDS
jgi:membrane protease YdiL (CAAX protease family)